MIKTQLQKKNNNSKQQAGDLEKLFKLVDFLKSVKLA